MYVAGRVGDGVGDGVGEGRLGGEAGAPALEMLTPGDNNGAALHGLRIILQ